MSPWDADELGAAPDAWRASRSRASSRRRRRSPAWWWARSSASSAHPEADKLRVCQVARGAGEPLQIVCGAPNARAGLKSAAGARSARRCPGDVTIKAREAARRRIARHAVLGAGTRAWRTTPTGIMELPADAPVGQTLRDYLDLDDAMLELNVTPNRGDAMSVLGIAREVAALRGAPSHRARRCRVAARGTRDASRCVLDAPAACPRFAGASIRGVDNRAPTPLWLRERLRRAGLRPHQPDRRRHQLRDARDSASRCTPTTSRKLHGRAFACGCAQPGEQLHAARRQASIALDARRAGDRRRRRADRPGRRHGRRSAPPIERRHHATCSSRSAYFAPDAIAGRARRFGLQTDASQRFERGVDPSAQGAPSSAPPRCCCDIAGGTPGPVHGARSRAEQLPQRAPVSLRARAPGAAARARHCRRRACAAALARAWACRCDAHADGLAGDAAVASLRYRHRGGPDRGSGAHRRLRRDPGEPTRSAPQRSARCPRSARREQRAARGARRARLPGGDHATPSSIRRCRRGCFPSSRASRWPIRSPPISPSCACRCGRACCRPRCENLRRQQDRVRLFELGTRFLRSNGAARARSTRSPASRSARGCRSSGASRKATRAVDFYDVKARRRSAARADRRRGGRSLRGRRSMPCLHPGRSGTRAARRGERSAGSASCTRRWSKALDLSICAGPVRAGLAAALGVAASQYQEISRFPQVRRDLAVVVAEAVPLSALARACYCCRSQPAARTAGVRRLPRPGRRNRSKKCRFRLDFSGYFSHSY